MGIVSYVLGTGKKNVNLSGLRGLWDCGRVEEVREEGWWEGGRKRGRERKRERMNERKGVREQDIQICFLSIFFWFKHRVVDPFFRLILSRNRGLLPLATARGKSTAKRSEKRQGAEISFLVFCVWIVSVHHRYWNKSQWSCYSPT